jgi:hypothetical protein
LGGAIEDREVEEDETEGTLEEADELAERGVDVREMEDLRVRERVAII